MGRATLALAIALTTCALGACTATWQELTPQPGGFALDSTKTYSLLLAAGDTLRVRHAGVIGDSVHWGEEVLHGEWTHRDGAVGLAAIGRVEVYEGAQAGNDDLVIAGVILASAGVILLLVAVGHSFDNIRF